MGKNQKPSILRGLKIKSVSVVDQGANQHAHIRLAKRAEDEDTETQEMPISDDAAFFTRIGKAVAKMLHMNPDTDEAVDKGDARSFSAVDGSRKTYERIYRISDALGDSLRSIVCDDELTDDQKAAMIVQSADQAAQAIKTDIAGMFNGTAVAKGEAEPDQPESGDPEEPEDNGKNEPANDPDEDNSDTEGEEPEMKFDTKSMTPEELAQLEDLQKRYGVAEEQHETTEEPEQEDVYKGLHPAVKAEIESLRKFREDAENREVMEIAKKYTIIGKKPEELAPVLKSLKDAGGSAYDDMIAVLNSAVEAVEKSGVFGEIGKRGSSGSTGDDAWEKIEVAADEIMKSSPNMTRTQAIDKACTDHPELVESYEKSRK